MKPIKAIGQEQYEWFFNNIALVPFNTKELRLIGEKPARREGTDEWVLLDYSDLVVHIQSSELRRYYMLDRLWNDCPTIELDVVKETVADGR